MKEILQSILDEIDQKWICLQIDFENASWRDAIPSEPGWYLIKTNTPLAVLQSVNTPGLEYRSHINIPHTMNNALILQKLGIVINQRTTDVDRQR